MLEDISEGEGDLTVRINADSRDELGRLAASFDTFVGKLNSIVTRIQNTVRRAEGISDSLSAGSQESAAAIMEMSRSLTFMSAQIRNLDLKSGESSAAAEDIRNLKARRVHPGEFIVYREQYQGGGEYYSSGPYFSG